MEIKNELAEWLGGKGYQLAIVFFSALLAYAFIALGGHYIFGVKAEDAHNIGLLSMLGVFSALFIMIGSRNNWFDLGEIFGDDGDEKQND